MPASPRPSFADYPRFGIRGSVDTMKYTGGFAVPATVMLIAGLLAGCAPMPAEEDMLVTSAVDPSTAPAFLAQPHTDADLIDDIDVTVFGVSTDSVRYQGQWEGLNVYLAVSGTSGVHIITGKPGDSESWGAGSAMGNSVIGLSMTDETTLQYVPDGSAHPPKAWHALSDYIIVRD